jgi:hypothetical protein
VIVTPDTVLRWQRRRFREYWTKLSHRPTGGRPPVHAAIKALITRMATANPLRGAPRIHGELLQLGIDVASAPSPGSCRSGASCRLRPGGRSSPTMSRTWSPLKDPWGVEKVELRLAEGEVHIRVALLPKATLWVCPECLAAAPIHDHRDRMWRHLDTCQYRTLVHARVPRLNCPTHGIRQVRVPWAEEKSRFTALFEALAIDWMKQAAIATVAERLGLSWDEAAAIQARAVKRGLARRTGDAGAPSGD